MREAPVFVQTFALAQWFLQHPNEHPLHQRNQDNVLALLDHVTLALRGIQREHHMEQADALTTLLRVHVRLASALGLLEKRQMLFLTQELDSIGRQLGAWTRRTQDTA